MQSRFFVTVFADRRRALLTLRKYDLDLFYQTARPTEDGRYSVEGLLTSEEIARLGADGYQVRTEAEASKRARATTEVVEFEEWLKGMDEE